MPAPEGELRVFYWICYMRSIDLPQRARSLRQAVEEELRSKVRLEPSGEFQLQSSRMKVTFSCTRYSVILPFSSTRTSWF